jgi:hypothetical protein
VFQLRADAGHPLVAAELGTDLGQAHLPWLRRRKIDSLFLLRASPQPPEQRLYDKVWHAQRLALNDVVDALVRRGIPAIVFKGAESFLRYYGGSAINVMNDLDILIPTEDLAQGKATLRDLGYEQAIWDPDEGVLALRSAETTNALEGRHYELAPFSKLAVIELEDDEEEAASRCGVWPIVSTEAQRLVVLEIDVHHGVARNISGAQFFDRAVASALGIGMTMSSADHLWFTTSRYYAEVAFHGKRSLRDLSHLSAMLKAGSINWDVVLRAHHDYRLGPSLYYFFVFLGFLNPNSIPTEIYEVTSPSGGSYSRDRGPLLEELFGDLGGPRLSAAVTMIRNVLA